MNETLKNALENRTVEVQDLNADALMSVGFRKWSKEYEGLLLVPLWAFDLLPDGTELTSIFGRKVVKGVDAISLDTRGSLLAFGIYETKESAEKRIPNGTLVQEKNGENRELKIVDAIEQNNQFGHGRFLYRFDGLTDVGFGLYHHEFNIIR